MIDSRGCTAYGVRCRVYGVWCMVFMFWVDILHEEQTTA